MKALFATVKSVYEIVKIVKEVVSMFKTVYAMKLKAESAKIIARNNSVAEAVRVETARNIADQDNEKLITLLMERMKGL